MADTQLAPTPPQATITIPAPTVTAGWAVPAGQPQPTAAEPRERRPKQRGIPASPLLAGAGNATALSLSAVYEAGGGVAVAAAGGAVALGALGAVVRRRRTVARRRASVRAARQTAGSWGGSGGGSRGSWQVPRTGSGSASGGGSRGSATGSRTSGTGAAGTGSRGSGWSGSGRAGTTGSRGSGTGTSAAERLGRIKDRKKGGKGKSAKPSVAERAARAAARGARTAARKTWKASRPHRAKAWATAKKASRRTRGLAADALKSLRSGVWGVLRNWSIKKGAAKALAAWKKHRTNRKTALDPTLTEPGKRTVASVARKPAHPNTSSNPTGGTGMPGHHFTGPAMEMARAAAAYQPTGMLQVGQDFIGLQQALELVAEAMKITVENADATQPLAPQIIDLMRQIHGVQLKAAELSAELAPAFRQLHNVDIERLENPRKGVAGERMWDVTTNLQ